MNRTRQLAELLRLIALDIINALVVMVLLEQIAIQTHSEATVIALGGAMLVLRVISTRAARELIHVDDGHRVGARILLLCAQVVIVLALVNTIADRHADSTAVLFLVNMTLGMPITLEGWFFVRPLILRERRLNRTATAARWPGHIDRGHRMVLVLVAIAVLATHDTLDTGLGLTTGAFLGMALALAPTVLATIGDSIEAALTAST